MSPLRATSTLFYYDLGSPYAYLAAERIEEVLPEPVEWQPISLGARAWLEPAGSACVIVS